jgi:hypothetical protein
LRGGCHDGLLAWLWPPTTLMMLMILGVFGLESGVSDIMAFDLII